MSDRVLITGADGYLGRRLALKYLTSTEESLTLCVRAQNDCKLKAKELSYRSLVGDAASRIKLVAVDLSQQDAFSGLDTAGIKAIIHAAAVTRFNVDAHTATLVNVEGSAQVFAFARRCPNLKRLCLVSTIYSSGIQDGDLEEKILSTCPFFANEYERSKWEAEQLLTQCYAELPWQIHRLATVIADNESGQVSQYNAFHNTLKLFFYGLLSLLPGKGDTPLYFITGDFAQNSIFHLLQSGNSRVFHICHTREESLTLAELIDLSFRRFGRDGSFLARRVLQPLYCDAQSFELLTTGTSKLSNGAITQAISSIAPFARQLFISKSVHNEQLKHNLPSYEAPDLRQLVESTCDFLVSTRWGREAMNAQR